MNLDYEEPTIDLVSFKALPANGFEQNVEIGLKSTNPNNFELPVNGISSQLNVAGEVLAHGVGEYFHNGSIRRVAFCGSYFN